MNQGLLLLGTAVASTIVTVLIMSNWNSIKKFFSPSPSVPNVDRPKPEEVDTGIPDIIPPELENVPNPDPKPLQDFLVQYTPSTGTDYSALANKLASLPLNTNVNKPTIIYNVNQTYFNTNFTLKCTLTTNDLPKIPLEMHDDPTHVFITTQPYQEYLRNKNNNPYNNAIPAIFANHYYIFVQVGPYARFKYKCDSKRWYTIEVQKNNTTISLKINGEQVYSGTLPEQFYEELFTSMMSQVALTVHGTNDIKDVYFYK